MIRKIFHAAPEDFPRTPRIQLCIEGPTIEVGVHLHDADVQDLRRMGRPVPTPWRGRAVVDTGASMTIISPEIAALLQLDELPPVDLKGFRDSPATKHPTHLVRMTFGPDLSEWHGALVASVPLATKRREEGVLLGRDFLAQHRLVYDGSSGTIELW